MKFTKIHGLGNDFILLDMRGNEGKDYTELTKRLCARQTGIGADGLLIVENSSTCDFRMRIINCDGSEAEMCGNGIRCFAKYVYERGLTNKTELAVDTLAGVIRPRLTVKGGKAEGITVDMGCPRLLREEIPATGEGRCIDVPIAAGDREFFITSMFMGVPHTVVFVDDATDCGLTEYGPLIEHHPMFPKGTNVDFAEVIDSHTVRMRTWERGCGPTLACGTGACATAVACFLNGKTGRNADLLLSLGTLHIEYTEEGNVLMTGPAEIVFDGELCE